MQSKRNCTKRLHNYCRCTATGKKKTFNEIYVNHISKVIILSHGNRYPYTCQIKWSVYPCLLHPSITLCRPHSHLPLHNNLPTDIWLAFPLCVFLICIFFPSFCSLSIPIFLTTKTTPPPLPPLCNRGHEFFALPSAPYTFLIRYWS